MFAKLIGLIAAGVEAGIYRAVRAVNDAADAWVEQWSVPEVATAEPTVVRLPDPQDNGSRLNKRELRLLVMSRGGQVGGTVDELRAELARLTVV